MQRRTKIVATIGPASRDPEILVRMVEAGMDVARLNFSHGNAEQHAETAQRVRDAANRAGRAVAVLQDLPGPKLRIGPLAGDIAELKPGDRADLRVRPGRPTATPRSMFDLPCRAAPRGRGDVHVPRRRLRAPARARDHAAGRRRDRRRGRDRRLGRVAPGPQRPRRARRRCRRCPTRTSSTSPSARRSASTSSRCRSCAAPRTSSSCASTRACR